MAGANRRQQGLQPFMQGAGVKEFFQLFVKKPELFNEGGRVIGPGRGDAFEQRGAGDQVLGPGAPMQLVLQ